MNMLIGVRTLQNPGPTIGLLLILNYFQQKSAFLQKSVLWLDLFILRHLSVSVWSDLPQRAFWSGGRGKRSQGHRFQADGGAAQQEHGVVRAAGSLLQQREHHQAHRAVEGGAARATPSLLTFYLQSKLFVCFPPPPTDSRGLFQCEGV